MKNTFTERVANSSFKTASSNLPKDFVVDSGNNFVCDISGKRYDPLPKEEQDRLFERLAEGDRSVRDELIRRNLRLLAKFILSVKATYRIGLDETVGFVYPALALAVDNFAPELGYTFNTFAWECMSNAVKRNLRYIRCKGLDLPKPAKKSRKLDEVLCPTTLFSKAKCVPYVDEYHMDKENPFAKDYFEAWNDDVSNDSESNDEVFIALDREYKLYVTRRLLSCLTPRQREVTEMHLGIGYFSALPLESVADNLGISGQAADMHYRRAIERMQTLAKRYAMSHPYAV